MEVVRIKEAAVCEEREAGTYVGTRGDEESRVLPCPRRQSEFTPARDEGEQQIRDEQIIASLQAECHSSSDGTAWPFQMPGHHGSFWTASLSLRSSSSLCNNTPTNSPSLLTPRRPRSSGVSKRRRTTRHLRSVCFLPSWTPPQSSASS